MKRILLLVAFATCVSAELGCANHPSKGEALLSVRSSLVEGVFSFLWSDPGATNAAPGTNTTSLR